MRVTAFYRRLGVVALALAMLMPQSGIMAPASLAQTADQDEDGLPDSWETGGVNVDPDGEGPLPSEFINLPAMGADPAKPDIFVHLDWMEDQSHSHKLDPNAIKIVVNAFADAPYQSPTGSTGINLHVDQGPDSILNFTNNTTWGELSKAGPIPHVDTLGTGTTSKYDWADFQNIKNDRFIPTGRLPIFHYVIAAHQYGSTNASGISRGVGSSDFIISLGAYTNGVGSVAEQAGTLMHELGHNLGLRHGGGDDINYKPNYLSVMNYSYQLRGLMFDGQEGVFDYSRRSLATLNERSLPAESVGLGPEAAPYGLRRFCPGFGRLAVLVANGAVDWNCDGKTTGVGLIADVNGDGVRGPLQGFDDWANISLRGGAIGRVEPEAGLRAQAAPPEVVPDDAVILATQTDADLLTPQVEEETQPEPVGDDELLVIPPLRARQTARSANPERTLRPSAAIPIGPLTPATRTLSHIAEREGMITVIVGVPGMRHVSFVVNGTRFSMPLTTSNDEQDIDVSSALLPGEENEIVVSAMGRPGSSIYVIAWDGDSDVVLDPDIEDEDRGAALRPGSGRDRRPRRRAGAAGAMEAALRPADAAGPQATALRLAR